jgi:long-subunit acyl-CoA synthetase (AMP-forming)
LVVEESLRDQISTGDYETLKNSGVEVYFWNTSVPGRQEASNSTKCQVTALSPARLTKEEYSGADAKGNDALIYIYTSGTTGE